MVKGVMASASAPGVQRLGIPTPTAMLTLGAYHAKNQVTPRDLHDAHSTEPTLKKSLNKKKLIGALLMWLMAIPWL